MQTPSPRAVTNFTGGKLSSKLEGQFEHDLYARGLRQLENFMVESHGGIQLRPGTFLIPASVDTVPHRLIPLVHAYNNGFILRIESGAIEVWTQAGVLADTITSMPSYATADLPYLQYQQANIGATTYVYIVHRSYGIVRVAYNGSAWSATAAWNPTGATLNTANNYPGAVCTYEMRLWFASTNTDQTTIWGSKSADFGNFTVGTAETDGLSYVIQGIHNARIEWMAPASEGIILGSMYGEGVLTGGVSPLTPANRFHRWLSGFGSDRIQGGMVGDAHVFAQIGGRTIRSYFYDAAGETYQSPDLTFHSDEIMGNDGCVGFAYQRKPDSVLWFLKADGSAALCTYQRLQEITAWQDLTTDGKILSVAMLPMTGVEERVFIECERELGGSTVYTLEYFDKRYWTERNAAHFLDCGLYYDCGAAMDVESVTPADPFQLTITDHGLVNGDHVRITGMTRYSTVNNRVWAVTKVDDDNFTLDDCDGDELVLGTTNLGQVEKVVNAVPSASMYAYGREISIVADGAVQPSQTYSSGDLALEVYANKVHVGLPYTAIAELMPTAFFRTQRVDKVWLRFKNTVGCRVGYDEDHLITLVFREVGDPIGVAPPLYSGDKEVEFDGDYDATGRVLIVQEQPLPFHLLAILADQTTYQKGA